MRDKHLLALSACVYSLLTYVHGNAGQHLAESQSVLDPQGDLVLRWRVDYSIQKVQFQLSVSESAPVSKWFAIGFSERGDLENSDVCVLWTDYNGNDHFEDMHADSSGRLLPDPRQDCEGFHLDGRTRTILFERRFDTCDDHDYVIEEGTVHVVWARGIDKLYSSKGLCLTCTSLKNHGFIRVRLMTPLAIPKPEGTQYHIANKDLKVPGGDTTYWCKVVKLPDFITEKIHHITQFESAITRGNEGLVHHMEVFYCDIDPYKDVPLYEGNCFAPERPEITKKCSKVKAAWAMGARPFTYPDDAGLPLGGPSSNKFVMLEVHYNNPELRNDWVDSSGFILYVTPNRRRYDAAIMELGLEYTDKMAIPPGQDAFPLTGYCVPQCTGVGLPAQGITVFGSQLHTHLTGVAVWTRHSRRGVELPVLNRDMHYSTHFQEIRLLHEPVKILPEGQMAVASVKTSAYAKILGLGSEPWASFRMQLYWDNVRRMMKSAVTHGDYLETTCIYRTLDRANATIGGHAITDEMCVNYLHYYPATTLEVCKSAVSNAALESFFNFERNWDNISIAKSAPPRQSYLSIDPWSPLRVSALHSLYTESPISMQCNQSDGNRFQGEWEGLAIPRIKLPLSAERRICPDSHNGIKFRK